MGDTSTLDELEERLNGIAAQVEGQQQELADVLTRIRNAADRVEAALARFEPEPGLEH